MPVIQGRAAVVKMATWRPGSLRLLFASRLARKLRFSASLCTRSWLEQTWWSLARSAMPAETILLHLSFASVPPFAHILGLSRLWASAKERGRLGFRV